MEKAASGLLAEKEMEHLLRAQELLFKRQFKQYSSKVCETVLSSNSFYLSGKDISEDHCS